MLVWGCSKCTCHSAVREPFIVAVESSGWVFLVPGGVFFFRMGFPAFGWGLLDSNGVSTFWVAFSSPKRGLLLSDAIFCVPGVLLLLWMGLSRSGWDFLVPDGVSWFRMRFPRSGWVILVPDGGSSFRMWFPRAIACHCFIESNRAMPSCASEGVQGTSGYPKGLDCPGAGPALSFAFLPLSMRAVPMLRRFCWHFFSARLTMHHRRMCGRSRPGCNALLS